MRMLSFVAVVAGLLAVTPSTVRAQAPPIAARGDTMLAEYFRQETARLAGGCLGEIRTLADWETRRGTYRKQLFEMLSLDPLPERTPLAVTYTGQVEHPEFLVKKLHFQSRPGLYVTGNLYLPRDLKQGQKLPAILYVCGHSRQKQGEISFGNKAGYQHHGAWFARNGYVCLTIDTLQLGEIEGAHHGTHNLNQWWWVCRGYTPAGVEAWNSLRALDLLESLPEVDAGKLGVTGRSGGGAYSWWAVALDDRVRVAVPVAGITDLENHVVDGCVEGHCDCMYLVNTYLWDYPQVAALAAPRPLLISNTDKDSIFPLEGVYRTHQKVREIYRLHGAAKQLGLQITEGPHLDTQELHIHAFHWFNKHLKGGTQPIDKPAEKFFEPAQLRVFDRLPEDQVNTKLQESFVPQFAPPAPPETAAAWQTLRDGWRKTLTEKVFRAWPAEAEKLDLKPAFSAEREGIRLAAYDFTSQGSIRLRLYVAARAGLDKSSLVVLNALDDADWREFLATYRPAFAEELKDEVLPEADAAGFDSHRKMFQAFPWTMAYVAPRGVGPTQWNPDPKKANQIRRRFLLLGQTLEGQQTWDVRRAAEAVRGLPGLAETPLWLQAEREMAGVALYASLFVPEVKRLDLHQLPASHRQGPIYLNVLRFFDLPQAVAMAAERSQVRLYQNEPTGWEFAAQTADKLGWDKKQLQVRVPMKKPENGGK